MGHSPRIIPPLITLEDSDVEDIQAIDIIKWLEVDLLEAKDNLITAKLSQTLQANKHRTDNFSLKIDDCVLLSTLHRHNDFKHRRENRVAKFMPRYNGPYRILSIDHNHSTITLDLPNKHNIFPTFHFSQIIPFIENNDRLFPGHQLSQPPPVIIDEEEYYIDHILDKRVRSHGIQYLVRWTGYSPEDDRWLPANSLKDCEVLDIWQARKRS